LEPRHVVVLVVVDTGEALGHERGHDVAAHVVLGALERRVARHRLPQRVGVEHVVAHGRQHLLRRVRQALGVLRLLQERPDPVGLRRVDVDHAELVGQLDRLPNRRNLWPLP
jgi:hypothetical protein